ncbi:hypothetical protein ACLB2K_035994 [Fragaria x ananassa]
MRDGYSEPVMWLSPLSQLPSSYSLTDAIEMERDYSGWLVKYRVDLNRLVAALPGEDWNACVVLGLSQEDETDNGVEDTSTHLLLQLPGKIISYNLREDLASSFR